MESIVNQKIVDSILSVVFPTFCPVCDRKLVEQQDELCEECLAQLPRTNEVAVDGNITEDKFKDIPNFVRGAAWLHFGHKTEVSRLIHKLKYQFHPKIGFFLGRAAAREYIPYDFFNTIDVIIPIPLHKKRFRQRGYNQAEWIARGISYETGIPVDLTHIERIKNNTKQANLMGVEREKNVSDIFRINHPEELYRKHILLVDDVITTGSTLKSCIQATIPFRGCQISVFTLAKAQ